MKRSLAFLAVSLILVICGIGLWKTWPVKGTLPHQAKVVQPEDEGGPPLHPYMIEAIRARDYPGGPISLEQELGLINGLPSYVIAYPSDGLRLRALMNTPLGAPPAGGWPVVILNHGYVPPEQYRTVSLDYRDWINAYARAGLVVIKPDYRGHDQSEGEPGSGNFGPEYTYDVLNLVASLPHLPQVDASRVGMLGHSMGGSVTLRAIAASNKIKAAVFAAGVVGSAEDIVYRWPRRSSSTDPAPPPHLLNIRQRLINDFGSPSQNPDFWHKISAINYLESTPAAIQIHHGAADQSVPVLFSENLHAKLLQIGKPHEYFIYPDGDHNFTGRERPLVFTRTLQFWLQNL
jgi:uncharacterized protein